jgi:hypothetical protein
MFAIHERLHEGVSRNANESFALKPLGNLPILVPDGNRTRMDGNYGEPSTTCNCRDHEDSKEAPMSAELLALLRHRVATRFYDQPQVIDHIARAIAQHAS